ncbi:MAG TPA: hypothetical protein VGK38_06930 [Prolixibacteraceae bacterium]|jgi:hypothetical protein
MNENYNDHSKKMRENLHFVNDYGVLSSDDQKAKGQNASHEYAILKNKVYSFIVEWQLPDIETYDTVEPSIH